jgi:hypothetical protein
MTDDLARRCVRAMHVVTPEGETLAAGRASVCILNLIGYPGVARIAGLPPFIWGVELGYWIVARNRIFFSWLLPKGQA